MKKFLENLFRVPFTHMRFAGPFLMARAVICSYNTNHLWRTWKTNIRIECTLVLTHVFALDITMFHHVTIPYLFQNSHFCACKKKTNLTYFKKGKQKLCLLKCAWNCILHNYIQRRNVLREGASCSKECSVRCCKVLNVNWSLFFLL